MAGLTHLHINATSEADWPTLAALADAHPTLLATSFGIHPWYIRTLTPGWLPRLRALLLAHPRAGIGEIGIDSRLTDTLSAPRADAFRAQLDLSYELARPVTLHCRGDWSQLLARLTSLPPHPVGILLHAYAGPAETLPRLATHRIYPSFGGGLLRPNARKILKPAATALPGAFLLESDAPPLAPWQIPKIAQRLADIRQTPLTAIATQTSTLFHRLFPFPDA